MIKSAKVTLKYSNANKLENIALFVAEYRRVFSFFVDALWQATDIPALLPKEWTSRVTDSWLSAAAIQCAGKQASGVVRGCKKKQAKRLWQINKFKAEGQFKKARKLQCIYASIKLSKPSVVVVNPDLDSRFIIINTTATNSFDGWVTLKGLGNKLKITVPFKKHKHFNKMLAAGTLKKGLRLSTTALILMFDLPDPIQRTDGKRIGIDIGQIAALTCSDGQAVEADKHGHTYQSICNKLARKKRGSKNFKQTERHRSNYLRWAVNQLDLQGVKEVNLENIKQLRKGKRTNRLMSHWNYAELFDVLESKLSDAGVQINKVSSTYTSQRCSVCGWVRKGNRKGKLFKCDKCSFECDADLNGSLNISFDLPPITKEERLRQANRKGFYWNAASEALTVPHA